ncbi:MULTISPECIES: hypothetical protein [Neisseria]|uniref:Uncharacterized protein n=1 Tax=Neisseria macacae ATCC 33926 TaxID=997348 RepID=A0ABY3Y8C2_9NEIS|nr:MULTISPECIES: hypothetical protein [Neisseria]UNV84467.1 hypothetical protein MON40_10700 [Neisseria macacae ATCC 33926]
MKLQFLVRVEGRLKRGCSGRASGGVSLNAPKCLSIRCIGLWTDFRRPQIS